MNNLHNAKCVFDEMKTKGHTLAASLKGKRLGKRKNEIWADTCGPLLVEYLKRRNEWVELEEIMDLFGISEDRARTLTWWVYPMRRCPNLWNGYGWTTTYSYAGEYDPYD